MSADNNKDSLEKAARLARRHVLKLQAAINSYLRDYPNPLVENIYRVDQEFDELKEVHANFEKLYDDLLDYCEPDIGNDETDPQRIAVATKKVEDKWLTDLSEVNSIYKDLAVKVQMYRDRYEGSQNRQSLMPSPIRGSSRMVDNSTFVISEPRLKPLEVPKFDGDPRKFIEFKELFENLIHSNTELANIQKMHRLKEALVGEAAEVARAFHLQDRAYPEAWSYLCLWYENKRGIIASYLKDLFGIPKIRDRSGIRKLVMDFDAIIRNLNSCDVNADDWSVLLSFHLRSKLDDQTKLDWDNSVKERNCYPPYDRLKNFLVSRAFAFDEDAGFRSISKSRPVDDKSSKPSSGKKSFSASVASSDCHHCRKGQHLLIDCAEFAQKSPSQRYNIVKKLGKCINCFGEKHSSSECRRLPCKECGQKHHTLLHFRSGESENPKSDSFHSSSSPSASRRSLSTKSNPNDSVEASKSCSAMTRSDKFVVLSTAVVRYRCGKSYGLARVLLDSGSQPTAVADTFVQRRRLPTYSSEVSIGGVGGRVNTKRACTIQLLSRFTRFELEVECDVLPATSLQYQVPEGLMPRIQSSVSTLKLAESKLDYYGIDLIIGGEYFEKCILNHTISLDSLTLRDSQFGWTVSGPIEQSCIEPVCAVTSYCLVSIRDIDKQVRRFIDCEEISKSEDVSAARAVCEAHFKATHSRLDDGRFKVRQPKTGCLDGLDGRSRVRAVRALCRLERNLKPELRREAVCFMKEYRDMEHMSFVPDSELIRNPCYYIPLLIVEKPDSTTTRVRMVFNASALTPAGISLNDVLLVGPVLQPELFDILIRFRVHKIAFAADIAKMYRQILIHEDDRDLQRIVWRDSSDEPIRTYRLNTITYGTASASFLATKCLDVLAESVATERPDIALAIRTCFYMDDLLTGAESVKAAIELQQGIHDTLASGQFPLRKYISNSPELLAGMDPSLVETLVEHTFDQSEISSILGLIWRPNEDALGIKLDGELLEPTVVVTKRIMLSLTSQIYDPLGFLAPFIIRFKILLQSLWKEQIGWDDPVPTSVVEPFHALLRELPSVQRFTIPRAYTQRSSIVRRELFGFCDASTVAYSAVVYYRTTDPSGNCESSLVCSKTRVAPLKPLTIHCLELMAAQLLSKLIIRISNNLSIDPNDVFCFSDSQVTLCWLSKPPEYWQVFVANRVRDIQSAVPVSHWAYIRTHENPADLPSRGISLEKLIGLSFWLNGPVSLNNPSVFECWKSESPATDPIALESRQSKTCMVSVKEPVRLSIFERFSSFTRLRAFVAWSFRFVSNARVPSPPRANRSLLVPFQGEPLSSAEYDKATTALIRYTQHLSYASEIQSVFKGEPLGRRSSLFTLQPFLDSDGILRITGRINNPALPFDKRHPIILPAHSRFVELFVDHVHTRFFHANRGFVKAFLANRFWLVGGSNNVIKRILRRCVKCARFQARTATQIMGQLPLERSTMSRPFSSVGVDHCGPFETKCVRHRSTIHFSSYLCVFVCMVTRAVHLELSSDLTTEKFLDAFKRFIGRRGIPTVVYSDNAKTFVAAAKAVASQSVEWKFIPPRAPHQGGLWEAAVKSAKSHLLRVTKGQTRTYEEYATLFTEIEAILNSRPLCSRRDGEQEDVVLTPGHFLTGDHLLVPSFPCVATGTIRDKWIRHQQTLRSFWSAWYHDYLNQLQLRARWHTTQPNFVVGEVVAVKDETLVNVGDWGLGLIEAIYPDSSGAVRSVDVRVGEKTYRRPITRLIRLPSSDSFNDVVKQPS